MFNTGGQYTYHSERRGSLRRRYRQYPAHLTDLMENDPTGAYGVIPNESGNGGVHGKPLTVKSNYHGPYLMVIPDNTVTKGYAEETDYIYNNQTGTVSAVDESNYTPATGIV